MEKDYLTIERERYDAGWPDGFHFAVMGASGTDKSSLVNALSEVQNSHPDAAPVGTTETTREVHRYEVRRNEVMWMHDIPSVSAASVEEASFFSTYKLRLYDLVLVVYSDRLREVELKILEACDYRHVPVCLVRTNSDQTIRNIMDDKGMTLNVAKKYYVETTLDYIDRVFQDAELPDELNKSVFLVNKSGLYNYVKYEDAGEYGIHEDRLVEMLDVTVDPELRTA
ncbi:hypothetical protein BO78DRAFT_436172 [Aspergillus sclerotiicarbonarius CBS 121057]|uniref:IRG-type G domain-containing protein n=1 Tax=Aspergillus sclerotiicarbonarius (strain CBS 121057 / IBT 28362) TaxID=1448318 RepID=A0A319DUK1_ASPSB|nr:hypothetical protein BO78DRAFT_436172 [Aspergillus sclerotiicarbonarius CBS 121057]